jgi:hypothetical protein
MLRGGGKGGIEKEGEFHRTLKQLGIIAESPLFSSTPR